MKICWDNLEKLRYNTKTGKWYTKTQTYIYKDSCRECSEPYLGRSDSNSKYCSISCSKKGNNSHLYGKFGKNHPRYKHGMYGTPTYWSWLNMRSRCLDKDHKAYKYYGDRGIQICDRWKDSFINFFNDMGVRPEGKTIDRIDTNGNYEPSNCRWATMKEQHENSRIDHNTKNGQFIKTIEYTQKIKCPYCQSENIKSVEPFDYIRQCEDCNKQFSTGVHN